MRGDTNESTQPTAHHSHRGHAEGVVWKRDWLDMKNIQCINPRGIMIATQNSR
jgi:hypothetical protein